MRLPMCLLATALIGAPALSAEEWARPLDWAGLEPLGPVEKVSRTEHGVELACAQGGVLTVSVLAPDLVRVRAKFPGQTLALDHSWAVAKTDWPVVQWQLAETPTHITLTTPELKVVIARSPLLIEFRDAVTDRLINADHRPPARNPQTDRLAVAKNLGYDEHFYGLGEKAARLDKRRGRFVMWNSDTPGYTEGKDPIYQSIPFYLGLEHGAAYGIFHDNAHRSLFDFGHLKQECAEWSAVGGELNYYFFHGPALKKIVSRYTELTGRMPMQPLWALGHQQSRYSYYPDKLVEHIAAEYRARQLPLDVLYLDIHYMDAYRVFTWDRSRFPDPDGLMRRLDAQGLKVVTIVDPGVKYQPPASAAQDAAKDRDLAAHDGSYYVFNEGLAADHFLKQKDGSLYVGEVWPGQAVFVDYTKEAARKWWGGLHRSLTDRGVDGVWTDMNEPADFLDQTGQRHENIVFDDLGQKSPYAGHRNLFALNMARATYEGLAHLQPDRRPFVITRAGYAGIQRYAVKWTGDNNATFAALSLNIPMFATLGLSGEAYVGADVPGFIGRGDGELLARAYQVAAFAPFLRNHTAIDQYDKEPWRFGPFYEGIVRKFLELRYRLLPFLYTTIEEAHRTGVPLFRPLVLNFQDDVATHTLDDQFMIGDALLAAPVTTAGQREREVYFPAGPWYDYWTGAVASPGGETQAVRAPIDHLPLYVRGGSIVPSTIAMQYTGEKPWNPLRFDVYPDAAGAARGSLYEDDGTSPAYREGVFRRTTITFGRAGDASHLTLAAPAGRYQPAPRNFEFILHAVPAPKTVMADGQTLAAISEQNATAGWFRRSDGALVVRMADDARAHVITLH